MNVPELCAQLDQQRRDLCQLLASLHHQLLAAGYDHSAAQVYESLAYCRAALRGVDKVLEAIENGRTR